MTDTTRLAQLIHAKHDQLVQLRQLLTRQTGLVAAGDLTALFDLLAIKQRVLRSLQQLERALEPFRRDDPDRRHWDTPAQRQACAAESDDCRRLLAEIVAAEKQCEQELAARRDTTQTQLLGLHAASVACDAYAGDPSRGSRQIDLCSEG